MMKAVALLALVSACVGLQFDRDIEEVHSVSPKLATLMKRAMTEPEVLANELRSSPLAQLAPQVEVGPMNLNPAADAKPIVVTHGMGDSCFNAGMKQITQAAGTHMGVYSVCIPGGPNDVEDTLSGFLVTMDKNVDIFAEKVKADPKLAQGFDVFGLSQGNSVIRGYIERYNEPPVRNYLAIHGTVMGVAGFPNCNPAGIVSPICDTLAEVLGDLAYAEIVQDVLFQANYFRDPMRLNDTAYLEHSQIAQWNNENPKTVNATYKSNFGKVQSYSMIKAMKDSMVFPNEGEWWGQFTPGQYKTIEKLESTNVYELFGLKEANTAQKIRFNSTKGNHLDFTTAQLEGWLDEYFH